MSLIKVSILFRNIDCLYTFIKQSGKPFWECFREKFGAEYRDFTFEQKGSMQSNFYVCVDGDTSGIGEQIKELISGMTSADGNYIVSVSEVSPAETKRLHDENVGGINEKDWFVAYLKEHPLSGENTESGRGASTSGSVQISEDKPTVEEIIKKAVPGEKAETVPAQPPQTASVQPLTLSGEIKMILEKKEQLLNIVKGQRHAVEEVLNTIFECDAFRSKDAGRTGPLASFLFTGPSGVGKTFLAKQCGKLLGRACKIIDMSEYSDNLSHGKFNGDFGQPAIVTDFIRQNPTGIIVFDEIEKAHINTIHLFLQILDEGHLTDKRLNKEISFKDAIIIVTTNAGSSLYSDTTECDLSGIPRRVILEALRKDVNPQTKEAYFPECIVTRFANGHVVLFNHLEPYALAEIIKTEIALQAELFKLSYGISVNYDPDTLAALIMYIGGGVSDARTLKGIARQTVVKELQESVVQTFKQSGDKVNTVKNIELSVDVDIDNPDVAALFTIRDSFKAAVFCRSEDAQTIASLKIDRVSFEICTDVNEFKKLARGVVDFALIDPAAGLRDMDQIPHDLEDVKSDGMDVFEYYAEHYPEIPVYLLDSSNRGSQAFESIFAHGARGVLAIADPERFAGDIKEISFRSHINNSVFSLGRSGKYLRYNSSQFSVDEETSVVMFSRLKISVAKSSEDTDVLVSHDKDNGITFEDVVGCTAAKKALKEYCAFLSNPREFRAKGKHIPNGVLLYGPPGTGKTMLAKAMANEADVAFIPVSATSFFGPYVGQSEGNVRELFARARKYAPSIVFIDEVDAIASRRTGSEFNKHSENVLNAFIAEMEGFSTDSKRPIFIMAATNYDISGSEGRVLDGAFVRRFDKRIFVDLPDQDARRAFFEKKLKLHGVDFGSAQGMVLDNLAKRTSGCNNSDLDKIVTMFIDAIGEDAPSSAVLMDMVDAFRFGEVNKTSPERLRQTACHESGHALVNRLLGNTPLFLTVVSRGNYGGYMEHQHDEDALSYSFNQLMNLVCCSLAGRAAEIEVYGQDAGLNTGASSDIEHARKYIKAALDDYAMGENLFSKNDDAIGEKLMREQYERTKTLIAEHRGTLDRLTDLLVQHKSLDQQQLEAFFAGESI